MNSQGSAIMLGCYPACSVEGRNQNLLGAFVEHSICFARAGWPHNQVLEASLAALDGQRVADGIMQAELSSERYAAVII